MTPNPFSLQGSTALVTGSSSGIGQAVATAIQAAGAKVIRHGIETEDPDPSSDTPYLVGDLLSESGPEQLLEAAFAHSPDLNLLICNAGNCHNAPFLEMTRERWDLTIDLNLKANYFAIQAFAKKLAAEKRSGSIVVTGSVNGFQAEINSSAYDTSKGGVAMMVPGGLHRHRRLPAFPRLRIHHRRNDRCRRRPHCRTSREDAVIANRKAARR